MSAKPNKREAERAMLIASFTLYGWRPMSAQGKHGRPTKETLLVCMDRGGAMLRIAPKTRLPFYSATAKTRANLDKRYPREWSDLTLPKLKALHECWLQRLAKESADARTETE